MRKQAQNSGDSAEEKKQELRRLAKDVESALSEATLRKSVLAFRLLEEVPPLYGIEGGLLEEVIKLKGERRHRLKEGLYDLFAKVGKSTSDEVLRSRIRNLILQHLAAKPRSGRRKKDS
jgi:hypothetical protein